VAYSAEIDVKVRNLGSITKLEEKLSSISRSVNAINKKRLGGGASGGGGSAKSELTEEQKLIQLENKRLRIQNQGLGVSRKALDLELKGNKLAEAANNLAQVESLTEKDQLDLAKNKILLADQEIKKKGLLLKAEQAINTEISKGQQIKSTELTAGDRVGLLGLSGKANRLSGKAASVIDSETVSRQPKGLPSSEMLKAESRGITRIVTQEERRTKALKRSAEFSEDILKSSKASAKAGAAHARKLESMNKPHGFTAQQFGPQFASSTLPTESALNFDQRTGKLLKGPAGSSKNTLGNLARRFDTQSALISGAFPLLFGQGPIGAVAGGLGGGIGGMFGTMGGFAGGIAATALVQQIQSAISAIGELGRALGPFARDTKAVTSALGLQGSAQEAQLQLIEQTQGKTAAFNAAMNFMATQIGQEGVNSLKRFGENSRRITASLTLATTKFQAFGASLLNFILRISGAEKQLIKAEQERTISFAASRGDETAKSILAEQKRIDALPSETVIVPTPGPFGGIVGIPKEIRSKEAKDAQEVLDKRRALFTVRENERINLAKINSEQGAHVQTLEEEFALVNRVNELVKEGNEKGLAQKLAKNEQINKKAIENINIRQDEVKRELEGLDKIKNKNDEQKLAVDELKEKQKFLTEELEKQPGILDDMNDKTKSLHSEVDKVTEAFKELSVTIGEDIKNGIKGLIKGTSTLSDLLNNVADKFLDVALNQALFGDILGSSGPKKGGLLGFLGFADGGRPPVGRPSIVGEKGPELFVPRSSGNIIPNNKLGGGSTNNVVVNVDASGSDVQGDEAAAKEIGTLISAAVQGELLKQQRPGGLLSR